MKRLLAAAMVMLASGCREPQVPRSQAPYSIHMFGAGEMQLRGEIRSTGIVYHGLATRDYAIGFANESPADIEISVLVDGLDARSGEPAKSCEDRCSWMVSAGAEVVVRGFDVDDTHVASYRFAPPDRALATFTHGARRDAIGTVEACVFSTKPSSDDVPRARSEFRGTLESEPTATAGELLPETSTRARSTCDRLLRRLFVRYEAEDGAPLGTAPPPAGVAKLVPRAPLAPPQVPEADDAELPVTPPKGVKPWKQEKRQKPPK